MSRSKARLAADWFAKLRINATTQEVEHENIVAVADEVTVVEASLTTVVSTDVAAKLDASSYTAADVLSKLLTVDGAGSGLDADTLDGNQATAFATAAQGALADSAVQPNDTFTATSPTASGSNGVRNITISTEDPSGGADGDVWFKY